MQVRIYSFKIIFKIALFSKNVRALCCCYSFYKLILSLKLENEFINVFFPFLKS